MKGKKSRDNKDLAVLDSPNRGSKKSAQTLMSDSLFDLSKSSHRQTKKADLDDLTAKGTAAPEQQPLEDLQNIEEIMNQMVAFVEAVAAKLDLRKEADREELDQTIIKHCIDCNINPAYGSDIIYETFNSIARERNKQGDIEASLQFLLLALEHIRDWKYQVEKFQGEMKITILSELYINICNAQHFLEKYEDVQKSAQNAIEISDQCIEILELQLKDQKRPAAELDRIENLLSSQRQLNVHANITIAQAYEQDQRLSEAIKQYNVARSAVKTHFTASHQIYEQMEQKIAQLTQQVKERRGKSGSDAMNVLIVSAKDEPDDLDDEAQTLEDLENQDQANRSIIGGKPENEPETIKGRGGRILKKKAKKTRGASRDATSTPSALKYQIRENKRTIKRNGSSAAKVLDSRTQQRPKSAVNKYFQTRQPVETYHINKRRELGVGLYDYQPTRTNLRGGYYIDQFGYKRYAPRDVKMARMEYDVARFANERNSHQLQDSCRHIGTHHNFSHQVQSLGISPVVGGPRSWFYCLSRPNILRPTHRSLVSLKHMRPRTYRRRISSPTSPQSSRAINEVVIKQAAEPTPKSQSTTDSSQQHLEQMRELRAKLVESERNAQIEARSKMGQLKQENEEQEQEIIRRLEEQQRQMIEEHRRAMEEENKLTMELMFQLSSMQQSQEEVEIVEEKEEAEDEEPHSCEDWRCQICNPPPQTDEDYGPPVFDPYFKCWTFPYAQPKKKEKKVVIKKKEKPLTHNMEVQVEYQPEPSPEKKSVKLQTFAEMTTATYEEASAQTNKVNTRAMQTLEEAKAPPRFTDDQAATIIMKFFRKIVMRKRLLAYRTMRGILYSRKYMINRMSGSLNIMSMHMICNYTDETCMHLILTIFDYVTRKFIYYGKYEHLDYVQQFNGYALLKLAEPSLKLLDFEDSPFTEHIACLQSVININREHDMISLSVPSDSSPETSSSSSYEAIEPSTPEPIYRHVAPEIKDQRTISTQVGVIKPPPPPPPKIPTPRQSVPRPRTPTPEPSPRYEPEPKVIRPDQWYIYYVALRWKLLYHIRWHMARTRLLLYRSSRAVPCCGQLRHFNVELWKVFKPKEDEEGLNFYYKLVAMEYQSSFRRAKKKQAKNTPTITPYHFVRLPGDKEGDFQGELLKCYLDHAIVLKLDKESCEVRELKLMRMKIVMNFMNIDITKNLYPEIEPVPFPVPTQIGCNLKLQFMLTNELLCKVYRRVRWEDPEKKNSKYKDWKVKVLINNRQSIYDYVVVHKLPCKLNQLEQALKKQLEVKMNEKVIPNVIQYIIWRQAFKGSRKAVDVKSQTYYDYMGFDIEVRDYDDRYNYDLDCQFYLTQSIALSQQKGEGNFDPQSMSRIPQIEYAKFKEDKQDALNGVEYCPEPEVAKKHDPFYEVLVQVLVPKDEAFGKCIMYQKEEAQQYSQRKNQYRIELLTDQSIYSSEESDPDISETGLNEWAWDERQLRKIQMDEHTKQRRYRKVTCQLTTKTQDQDWFVYDHTIGIWGGKKFAHQDTVYQYLLAELRIHQNAEQEKIRRIDLRINDLGDHYLSDEAYLNHLSKNNVREHFLAQDTYKWKNQDFANTVYSLAGTGIVVGGRRQGGFLVEAVHIPRPYERAYRHYEDLATMRDGMLTSYLDEELELYAEAPKKRKGRKDQQIGQAEVVKAVKFKTDPATFIEAKKKEQELGDDDDYEDSEEEEEQMNKFAKKIIPKWKAWTLGQRTRRAITPKIRKYSIVAGFLLSGDKQSIYIVIQKYLDKPEYQFVIFNQMNQKKRDDIQFIKRQKLPPGLDDNSPQEYFEEAFQWRLAIEWKHSKLRTRKIQSADIDYKEKKLERAPSYESSIVIDEPEPIVEEPKPKEDEVPADLPDELKADIKMLKEFLGKLKEAIAKLEKGIDQWWTLFDTNLSNMIEFDEFLKMLEDLDVFDSQRNVYLLFHLFDSEDVGYFTKIQFEDLIYEFKRPDYVQVVNNFNKVYQEKLDGLRNPKKPEVIKTKEIIEVPEEIVKEKIIYQDKIVYEDVIVHQQAPPQQAPNKPTQPAKVVQKRPEVVPQQQQIEQRKPADAPVAQPPAEPAASVVTQSTVPMSQDKVIQEMPPPSQRLIEKQETVVRREPARVQVQQPEQQMSQPAASAQPSVTVVDTKPILQQEDVAQIQERQSQPEAPQNYTFQPFRLDQDQAEVNVEKPEKVQLQSLRLQLQDLFLPLATVLKSKRQKPDQVFKKYDKNSSQQLSVQEAAPLFREFINVDLDESEKKWLLEAFKKEYHASEIKKQIFVKLVEAKAVRKYNMERAEEAYGKLVRGLSADQFGQLFNSYPNLVVPDRQVCLRNFKVIMKETEYLTQLEIDSLTQYLHKQEDGFIRIDDFYKMKTNEYDPSKESRYQIPERKDQSSADETIISFYDLIKPFQHKFLTSDDSSNDVALSVEQLFKKFDRKRGGRSNMLMSVDEFKDMLQYYCKYKLEPSELQVIKEYFENYFQRTEIKRSELQQMIQQKCTRRYNAQEALEMYAKLKRPLGGQVAQVKQLFAGAVEENNMINIRNFKKCIEKLRTLKQGDNLVFGGFLRNQQGNLKAFSSFTQYLEQSDNGFINIDVFDKVDLKQYQPEEIKVEAEAEQLFTYTTFRDLMKEIRATVQAQGLDLNDLFERYDKDKSLLLSHIEISKICNDHGVQLDKAETQVIDKGLRKVFGRADIKKAEFAQIINQNYERRFDEAKARATFKQFFMRSDDRSMIEKLEAQCPAPVPLRAFKKLLDANFNCQNAIDLTSMDQLAQFLEQKDDGKIDIRSLRQVLLGQYTPTIAAAQQKKI